MSTFRHNSAYYYLPRYKSENALLYRFGWKNSKMIHYYTEMLGMRDTLQEEDFLVDVTKIEIERQLEREQKNRASLSDEVSDLESQLEN